MTTLTLSVGASTDDGCTSNRDTASSSILTANAVEAGSVEGGSLSTSGFRFTGCPKVTFTSATLVLTSNANYNSGGTISVKGACHAADNAGTFQASPIKTFDTTQRPRTTQTAAWDIHNWALNTEYSLDVTAQVQAVVNRVGFVDLNAVVVLLDDNGSTVAEWQECYAWDDAANRSKVAKLVLVYTVAGTRLAANRALLGVGL